MATTLSHDEPPPGEAAASEDEERIRELGQLWIRAIARKRVDELTALLSERSVLLPPAAESIKGRDGISRTWRRLLDLPGFTVSFEPHRTRVYPTGDVAHDISRYRLTWEDADGRRLQDHGNHLIVWERHGSNRDARWSVRSNVFDSKSLTTRPWPLENGAAPTDD